MWGKKIQALILMILLCCNVFAGTKKALVVIVGDYPEQSGCNRLASANDKIVVMDMLERCGFKQSDITCLLDADATFSGILDQFAVLEKSCLPGDQIYVHFSCHGQEITDLDGDEALADSNDRYDEAIVPYDAGISYGWNGYVGEHHLTDDMLNPILNRIAKKIGRNGCLLVVNDACHGGGIERDEEPDSLPPFRGAWEAFELPLTAGQKATAVQQEINWISISACKSFQTNWECCIDGKMYGRLSYAMSRCFRNGMTPDSLADALKKEYAVLPMPEGKVQSIQVVIPDKLKRKRMFPDE